MIRWPSPLHRLRSHSKYLKAAQILYKSRSVDENMSHSPWHCNSDFCQEACACVFSSLSVRNKHTTLFGAWCWWGLAFAEEGEGRFRHGSARTKKLNAQLDVAESLCSKLWSKSSYNLDFLGFNRTMWLCGESFVQPWEPGAAWFTVPMHVATSAVPSDQAPFAAAQARFLPAP